MFIILTACITIILTPIFSIYELYSEVFVKYPIILIDMTGISEYYDWPISNSTPKRKYRWSEIQTYDFINGKIILNFQMIGDIVKYDLHKYSTDDSEELQNIVMSRLNESLGKYDRKVN